MLPSSFQTSNNINLILIIFLFHYRLQSIDSQFYAFLRIIPKTVNSEITHKEIKFGIDFPQSEPIGWAEAWRGWRKNATYKYELILY